MNEAVMRRVEAVRADLRRLRERVEKMIVENDAVVVQTYRQMDRFRQWQAERFERKARPSDD